MGFAKGKKLNLRSMRHPISAFLTALALCLSVFSYAWATSPPQDSKSYRGDINGDFVVTLSEVVAARDLTALQPVNCVAVIPGDATKCDTADLTGDSVLTLADVVAIRDLSALKSYTTPDGPWILDTSGIPANVTYNAPVQAAITNISGIGRPGIVVRFSIASGPATLSGREYNPVDDGIRDHASPPGATQVLAITQTDFPGDQTGATELTIPNVGTPVEITCTGDGTVTLNVVVLADALKGIPALSASPTVDCTFITECNDGTDNDGDTFTDYPDDPGCSSALDLSELSGYQCDDGVDSDGDTYIDYPDDPGCTSPTDPFEIGTNQCDNAKDDDGDTAVDYPYDPGCSSVTDNSEFQPECNDGIDNDGDTLADFPNDPGCTDLNDNTEGIHTVSIGTATGNTDYPFTTSSHDARIQVIYLASEIGVPGDILSLSLNVLLPSVSGQVMNNFTIRMKHTTLPYYSLMPPYSLDNPWEGPASGWTTVYQDNLSVTSAGWKTFTLSTPFSYNGVYNLMVDFSFDNTFSTDASWVWTTSTFPVSRFLHNRVDSTNGNPLNWSGTTNPVAYQADVIPDILFDIFYIPPECSDLNDNDGDTLMDFPADPSCTSASDHNEGTNECDDGVDNDGDTKTDYPADPGCIDQNEESEIGLDVCDNGIDEDGDTLFDYPDDPSCTSIYDNDEGTNECDDGVDNDGDLVIDTTDPGCFNDQERLTERGECQDGYDNDGDTLQNYPSDPGCSSLADASEYGINECDDGIDNDGDSRVDAISDPGCEGGITDTTEINPTGPVCDDGIDNDGDTAIDTADPACFTDPAGPTETGECQDGVDNDGDTQIDFPDDLSCLSLLDGYEVPAWKEYNLWSASGGGISNNTDNSGYPSLSLDASGYPVVAWEDASYIGYADIFIKRWNGSSWVEIGAGSATEGIISDTIGNRNPSLVLESSGYPVVAWWGSNFTGDQIYIKRWNGSSWVEIGAGSASGGGISNNTSISYQPSLALDSSGFPVVAWTDWDWAVNGREIYIKRWNGSSWMEIGAGSATGGGISNSAGWAYLPSLVLDSSGNPVVAWQDDESGDDEIYIKRWNGSSWVEIGVGSASGGGISNSGGVARYPTLALDTSGNPVVAWDDSSSGNVEVYIKRWNGSSWVEIGVGSATGGGISNNAGGSFLPTLALDASGNPVVAWSDSSGGNTEIYIKRWNGSSWEEIGAGSASGGGISNDPDSSSYSSLALKASGDPVVAWQNDILDDSEIYIKHWVP